MIYKLQKRLRSILILGDSNLKQVVPMEMMEDPVRILCIPGATTSSKMTYAKVCIEMKKSMGPPAKRRSVSSVEIGRKKEKNSYHIILNNTGYRRIPNKENAVEEEGRFCDENDTHRAFECNEVESSILTKRTSTLTTVKIKASRFIKTS
ncbi:unnamed protein product [Mytilus coruscus]|uniref:Uncharacterized protein n=1 Tax=Mytilus coruscus TaxID=42192 RepID=A0A6J8ESM1_MYTCO|nr:unnamed protein product [Mytilus coruscus]